MSVEYKRLGWLQAYASQATGLAGNVYTQARGFVPGFAEPFVLQLEETAFSIAVPYVTVAQDTAEKVLSTVDAQVRWPTSVQHACRAAPCCKPPAQPHLCRNMGPTA